MAAEMDGTSKGLLGAFAVFTLGSGIASLIYGIYLLIRYIGIEYSYGYFNLFTISIVLIVVGGLLIITVILGVIGALRDVSNLRMATLVLLFLLFVVLAVIGGWGMFSFKTGQLQRSIDDDVKKLNQNYNGLSDADKKRADYLNQHYNCCGSYSAYDEKADNRGIPESCCVMPSCARNTNNAPQYYEKGCASVYYQTKSGVIYCLAILALAAAVAVLLGLIFYGVAYQRARAGYAAVSRG